MRLCLLLLSLSAAACSQQSEAAHAIWTPTTLPAVPALQPTANVLDGPVFATNTGTAFSVSGTVTNTGTRCARAVSGQIRFSGAGFNQTLDWSLPAGQILQPLQTAPYVACCLPLTIAGQNIGYLQLVSQESVTCP